MKKWLTVALVLLASRCLGQSITLPKEIKADPGRLVAVALVYDGDDVRWDVPSQIDAFREYDADPKAVRLRLFIPPGTFPGNYRLLVVTAKEKKLSDFAVCNIVVGGVVPPAPTPLPPPPIPPAPPGPAPVDKFGFVALAKLEGGKVASPHAAQASGLADNFDAVASKLAATQGMTVAAANAELLARNRVTLDAAGRAAWLPFFLAWEAKANALSKSGALATPEHYVGAYTETASGLRLSLVKKE